MDKAKKGKEVCSTTTLFSSSLLTNCALPRRKFTEGNFRREEKSWGREGQHYAANASQWHCQQQRTDILVTGLILSVAPTILLSEVHGCAQRIITGAGTQIFSKCHQHWERCHVYITNTVGGGRERYFSRPSKRNWLTQICSIKNWKVEITVMTSLTWNKN